MSLVLFSCEHEESVPLPLQEQDPEHPTEQIPLQALSDSTIHQPIMSYWAPGQQISHADFDLNLLSALHDLHAGTSFACSPFSLTSNLSMLLHGADGQLQQRILQVLGFKDVEEAIAYLNRAKQLTSDSATDMNLTYANALFVSDQYRLLTLYQQELNTLYDASVHSVDFTAGDALLSINAWSAQATHGLIPNVLESINPDAKAYLLNALLFKAPWNMKFSVSDTRLRNFYLQRGGSVMLPLMQKKDTLPYARHTNFEVVAIPFAMENFAMEVILPHQGKTVDDALKELRECGIQNLFEQSAEPKLVRLNIPRFHGEDNLDLRIALNALGLETLFDGSIGQLSNIIAEENLVITNIRQNTSVTVSEDGAEVAAVTISEMDTELRPDEIIEFLANRPFIYIIRDRVENVSLLMGVFEGVF